MKLGEFVGTVFEKIANRDASSRNEGETYCIDYNIEIGEFRDYIEEEDHSTMQPGPWVRLRGGNGQVFETRNSGPWIRVNSVDCSTGLITFDIDEVASIWWSLMEDELLTMAGEIFDENLEEIMCKYADQHLDDPPMFWLFYCVDDDTFIAQTDEAHRDVILAPRTWYPIYNTEYVTRNKVFSLVKDYRRKFYEAYADMHDLPEDLSALENAPEGHFDVDYVTDYIPYAKEQLFDWWKSNGWKEYEPEPDFYETIAEALDDIAGQS